MNNQWHAKKIEDLMKKNPYCIAPNHTISDVLLRMEAHEINHLPVTETGKTSGRLLGIVTRRDLERHLSGNLSDAHIAVLDFMSPLRADYAEAANRQEAHILIANDSILLAVDYFANRLQIPGHAHRQPYVSALVVVDEKSNVIGIVSYKDILRELIQNEIQWSDQTVKEHMTKVEILTTIARNTPFSDIYALFRTHSYRTLPVVEPTEDCQKLVGLVEDVSAYEMAKSDILDREPVDAEHTALMFGAQHLHIVLPDENIQNVLSFFLERPYHDALLVVKDPKLRCLVGLLSYVDVFKHLFTTISDKGN